MLARVSITGCARWWIAFYLSAVAVKQLTSFTSLHPLNTAPSKSSNIPALRN